MKTELLSKAVRYALVAGAATALTAPAVFAQDANQSTVNQNQNTNTAQLGKIEVTGTRIKRTDVETAQPVTVVTAAQIKATGLTSIADVLQELSSVGASFNTQFNNGGTGASTINLRNLTSQRVLVLINGQRVTPDASPGNPDAGAVDLNNIPVSIIDHVEVLQDGASAIYGSDAIAGVVNIITIKNFNGAEANAYYGMFDGHADGGGWDGKTQEYDFTIGSSGDHSGVLMNVAYVNQSPVLAGNRTISKEPVIGGGQAAGSSGTPSGRFKLILPGTQNCPGSATTTPLAGGQNFCDLTLINPGTATPTLGNFRDFQSPGDRFNFAPLNYLVTPSERTSLFVQGHYDLADNLTFNSMAIYNHRVSQQLLAPNPTDIGSSGSNQVNGQPIQISGKNPFNPFGVDLVGSSATGASAPACLTVVPHTCDELTGLDRRSIELGNRVINQDVGYFAFRGGFQGYFNLLGSEWDWDLGYNYGNIVSTNRTSGDLNTERLQNALGLPGQAPCQISATNTGTLPGCVPFNIFGGFNPATGQGSITPAMANYVLFEEHNDFGSSMRDYTANITGSLFNLPAGPVGLALGAESLEHDGFFHPDALVSAGNTTDNVSQPTNGREYTKAEYVEFNIPLVTDQPFMKDVSLDVANRWSQFKWSGGNQGAAGSGVMHSASNTSGRAALRWQATDALLLRGSWSQGFRIPNISEFFAGTADSFPGLTDPCVATPAQTKAGFCGASVSQPNPQIHTTIGGNPNMTPERSISRTAGFVYNPNWLPGFDFSADYFKIDLLNAVSSLPAQTVLNGCYIGGNANFCNLITRSGGNGAFNQNGIITNVLNTNVNIGGIKTEGVDVQTDYKFPSTSIGDFKASLNITFTKQYVLTQAFGSGQPGSPILSSQELSGTTGGGGGTVNGGFPKQRANFGLNWNYGNWSAVWQMQYTGHMIEDCASTPLINPASRCPLTGTFPFTLGGTNGNPPETLNHIGATTYHDVAATYHLDAWNTDFTVGIRNLFDKQPPIAMSSFANSFLPTFYRTPGRFFFARVGVKF